MRLKSHTRLIAVCAVASIAVCATVLSVCNRLAAEEAFDSTEYPFDIDQGGWVDEEAGLVWAYNSTCVLRILNVAWSPSNSFATFYPISLQDEADNEQFYGDLDTAAGDAAAAAGNMEDAEWYWAEAAEHYELRDAFHEAHLVAAGFEGWRLPTIEEAEAAHAKGLFNFTRNLFNAEGDPLACGSRFDAWRWTSSGNSKFKYRIQPLTGEVQRVRTRNFGVPLVVRSLNPDTGDEGPGNGNGKGKNK